MNPTLRSFLVLVHLIPASAFAADPPAPPPPNPVLVQALAGNAVPLRWAEGKLSGPGAELLRQEAAESQFFLVGEDHGLAAVPRFAAALYREIRPLGYHHLALETGPLTAETLESLARSPEPEKALADFDRRFPFAVPFYNWREEAELLPPVLAGAPKDRRVLWGLDQEFILSPAFLLPRLAESAKTPAARALVQEYLQRSLDGDRRMREEGNPAAVLLASATDADFQRLEDGLRPAPGSEAARILAELRVSRAIYAGQFAPQDGAGLRSNAERAALMKRHFLTFYEEARKQGEAQPKVLFKFGVFHTVTGRSFTQAFEIGTFARELAEANGRRSFHLFVMVAKGAANAYRPFGSTEADKSKPYDAVKELDVADVRPLLAAATSGEPVLFDLRPLRLALLGKKYGAVHAGLERLLVGNDAILLLPESAAATLR